MAGLKKQKSRANNDTPIEQSRPDSKPDNALQPQAEPTTPKPTSLDIARAQASSSTASPSRPNSWYNAGGSWRAKASPVAQIAKESVSVAKGATSEASEEAARRPSQSVSKGMRGSRKSVPLLAEATRVHATSEASAKAPPRLPDQEKVKGVGVDEVAASKGDVKGVSVEEAPLPPEPADGEDVKSVSGKSTDTRPQSAPWFGWWSRPDGYGSETEKGKQGNKRRKLDTEEASSTPLPGSPEPQPADAIDTVMADAPVRGDMVTKAAQWEGVQPEMSVNQHSTRSWFGLWSNAQNEQAVAQADPDAQVPPQEPEVRLSVEPPVTEAAATRKDTQAGPDKKQIEDGPKSSGWAFWSSDKPSDGMTTPSGTQKEVGEIAVADTPSQSHPEAAQFNEQSQPKADVKRGNSLLKPKRGRTERVKEAVESLAASPIDSKAQTPTISQVPTPAETPPRDTSEAPAPIKRGKVPQTRPNLVLPLFRDLYPPVPSPGYLERLSTYLSQALRLPNSDTPPPPQHVYFNPNPPKIRKAIAIGVHGFFPAPLIQKVLGQPTGTSIRFANYAAASIKTWCAENQPSSKDGVEIEKVALEGEGTINDRVTTLWKLLLNWLSHLRQADFILLAAHSQGAPVAVMLLAKLIQLGCLAPNVKIGICAMAGINLGPFLEYKSRLFGGSALELFDFCDAGTAVSKSYVEALDVCLRHGVRISFVGSLDDQLVSLESSLYAPLGHPYINRAVFIDGRLHAPNFLTHLVVFALKLRNRGISDHGLLRELSAPLAGSLVGGDGHSRIYDEAGVYSLAIDFALRSTDFTPSTLTQSPDRSTTAAASLLANDKDRSRSAAAARRASLSGYPTTPAQANSIRRGEGSATANLPGTAPVFAHFEAPTTSTSGGVGANPFTLPWAVRGMLEEGEVKRDGVLMAEVRELVEEFEEWRPQTKILRDVRFRLEGVRSLL
ncbi:hypothetical protein LTR78_000566 [Recurvomyces mirabilis]|uniref:YMC020W-like alpha/beta hydrolase domain-containing protein n=1 Tax=Recurvomyces mirabilis TaxID=574656 RepID=A0AAE0WY27_9PEZI|nr:hypothetical protein LTR78_000566 [Recurvomyces mirabilis]KAK5162220.1 hypothetical protein LTS14_000566 [Recurvomyces mirabilis]